MNENRPSAKRICHTWREVANRAIESAHTCAYGRQIPRQWRECDRKNEKYGLWYLLLPHLSMCRMGELMHRHIGRESPPTTRTQTDEATGPIDNIWERAVVCARMDYIEIVILRRWIRFSSICLGLLLVSANHLTRVHTQTHTHLNTHMHIYTHTHRTNKREVLCTCVLDTKN